MPETIIIGATPAGYLRILVGKKRVGAHALNTAHMGHVILRPPWRVLESSLLTLLKHADLIPEIVDRFESKL